jgi:phospholipid/cholesterol/gamma-HCH transport system permease protein
MPVEQNLKLFLNQAGELTGFTGRFFKQCFKPRYEMVEFFRQCYIIGYKSLPLVGLTAFIMGLVLTMQLRPAMLDYGVESELPAILAIAIVEKLAL